MNGRERQNVGTVDALIRITVGLAMLGAGGSRRFSGPVAAGMLLVGGLQVAQGLLRWDPIWEALGIDTTEEMDQRLNPYGMMYPTYEEEAEAFESTSSAQRKSLRWPGWRRSRREEPAEE